MVHGSDLVWLCVKKQSCFLRKNKQAGPLIMSAEPGNLTGENKQKYSALAHSKSVSLHSKKVGKKEKIIITSKSQKADSLMGGKNHHHTHGVSKGAKSLCCPHVVAYAKSLLANDVLRHEICDETFREADTDGSGDLSPDEVVKYIEKCCKEMKIPCPATEKVRELVQKVDKNGDGALQKGEFRTAFKVVLNSCTHKADEAGKAVPGLTMFLKHRPDLATELVAKYHKVKKSFKKKKSLESSRKAPEA